jgi:hypothetical protein
MFKTTAIDTLKQDKKCQACWYMILSTMSGSTTVNPLFIIGGEWVRQQANIWLRDYLKALDDRKK